MARANFDPHFARGGLTDQIPLPNKGFPSGFLENLKGAGGQTVYVDGSFVTSKEVPNDFDACWEEAGVDPTVLDPVLLTFDPGRFTQKAKYLGELFPASAVANGDGFSFLEFFQTDKESGRPKGIVAIHLGDL